MIRKEFSLRSMVIVTTILFFVFLSSTSHEEVYPSISMLNIGQGDSFLLQSASGTRILIDGGRDINVLSELAKILSWRDKTIDVVIATHPDADHIGGLASVLTHYNVSLFLTSDVRTDTQTEVTLLDTIRQKKIPAYFVRHGMHLALDQGMRFDVLFPDRPTTNWETNSASVVGRLQIGTVSALFTGDSPSAIESYLAHTIPSAIDVDILKLGHHGSKYSSSDLFLETTSPTLALISAGVGNRYGHPAGEVLTRLTLHHIPWVSTQQHGLVTLTTDGESWTEEDEK